MAAAGRRRDDPARRRRPDAARHAPRARRRADRVARGRRDRRRRRGLAAAPRAARRARSRRARRVGLAAGLARARRGRHRPDLGPGRRRAAAAAARVAGAAGARPPGAARRPAALPRRRPVRQRASTASTSATGERVDAAQAARRDALEPVDRRVATLLYVHATGRTQELRVGPLATAAIPRDDEVLLVHASPGRRDREREPGRRRHRHRRRRPKLPPRAAPGVVDTLWTHRADAQRRLRHAAARAARRPAERGHPPRAARAPEGRTGTRIRNPTGGVPMPRRTLLGLLAIIAVLAAPTAVGAARRTSTRPGDRPRGPAERPRPSTASRRPRRPTCCGAAGTPSTPRSRRPRCSA